MFFMHYKGKYYQKISEVLNVHTEKIMVLYITLYTSSPRIFVREKENFEESIVINSLLTKRFESIEKSALPEETFDFILNEQDIALVLTI